MPGRNRIVERRIPHVAFEMNIRAILDKNTHMGEISTKGRDIQNRIVSTPRIRIGQRAAFKFRMPGIMRQDVRER